MNGQGTNAGLIRIRVIAADELLQEVAQKISDALEAQGFEMLEWSDTYPCNGPDLDKSRLYLMAKAKTEEGA
jgi:hypothetical protein